MMAGHANFFKMKKAIRNARRFQNKSPKSGVKIGGIVFKILTEFKKYCIRRPVLWMQ
jgi:hypothetical protein